MAQPLQHTADSAEGPSASYMASLPGHQHYTIGLILSLFCAVILMIYSVSTRNLGTLYRVRYAYLMVFVAMGIMGMATLWRDWRARERLVHSRVAPSIEVRP